MMDGCVPVKLTDRPQKPPAIAKNDSKFLEVCVSQITKDREIDTILGEPLGIFGHAKFLKPSGDVTELIGHGERRLAHAAI